VPDVIVPVILAGGQGTRLWPLSRSARPKQFLPLTGAESLFQETLRRVSDKTLYAPAVILTNADYRFLVAEQALEVGALLAGVLLEPVARNTAAAIAVAAIFARNQFGENAVLHILASDHAIDADAGYWNAVRTAADAARKGWLVTFGIAPTAPETGYGYIEAGDAIDGPVATVKRFTEKPQRPVAETMIASGRFSWNSGMFMLGAKTFIEECRALAPETLAAAEESVAKAKTDLDFIRIDADAFARAPNISVDYAIFEKTKKAAVLPVSFGWSDLGSWDAVWKASPRSVEGNVGTGSVTFDGTTQSLVVTEKAHVAVGGLDDVVVIASEDAIYVGRLSDAQRVGPLVKTLRAQPDTAPLTEVHRTMYRPWGGYSSILNGERFQVKRLFVKPGKQLSLQRHNHRSEHWVVVRGIAEVTRDKEVFTIRENESIYLPVGCEHRLANPGKIVLELIEVQTGSYLGEDDIVRIEDDFGRT
jgi:mannose-1-phosphate guanylyltransferase